MNLLKKILLVSGIAVLAGCNGELGDKKYDIKKFTIIDTLKTDTFEENMTTEQVCNFGAFNYPIVLNKYLKHKLSREEVDFKTFNNFFHSYGLLHVSRKEFSAFELIGKSVFKKGEYNVNEVFKSGKFVYEPVNIPILNAKRIERKCLVDKFYYLDKNLKIDELSVKGISFSSEKPSFAIDREYTNKKIQDKKFLDKEQEAVKNYLNKILEHKKSLKD